MTANLKPYPNMKDSGVEWIGEVPSHWEVRRLKRICRFAYGDSLSDEIRRKGNVPVFGSNGRVGSHCANNTSAPCIIVGRKGSFGKVNYSRTPVFAIDTTFYVDPRYSSGNIRWLYFLLGWLKLDDVTRDSAVPGLNRDDAYRRVVPIPSPSEQADMAHFLDQADCRIQRYLRAKHRLIVLLEEMKQAVIDQAVTGQIDVRTGRPYAVYKPSGVAVLGEAPEAWEVRRFKSLVARIEQGVSPQAENYLAEGDAWGVLKAGCVNGGVFREREHKRLAAGFAFNPNLAVRVGDVLVSRASGSTHLVGSVGRVSSLTYRLILSDKTFRPVFTHEVDPDFMVLAMNSRYYRRLVEQAISGAEGLANNLPLSALRCFHFAVPTLDEQRAIARHLLASVSRVDGAAAGNRTQIKLVKDLRSRLIADVVTGRLDVREAVITSAVGCATFC